MRGGHEEEPVNYRYRDGMREEPRHFKDFKTRFDSLKKQLHDIHDEWLQIHAGTSNSHGRHEELVDRELKIYAELNPLMNSITEGLGRNLERSRKAIVRIGNSS